MGRISDVRTDEWENLPDGFSPDEPLYVLTDIHGCYEAMMRLMLKRPDDARLVFLGDAVDRGPDPMGVLSFLMKDDRNILLRGNHDAMAWFAQPEVFPSYEWAAKDWMRNGGRITLDAFREALDSGVRCGEIARTVPLLFEDYWFRGNEWWQSGNMVFVHAGLPRREGRKWLSMDPRLAASRDDSPYWWRPDENEMFTSPRVVDGREVFTVFGHTPMEEIFAFLPYAISLDRGYELKMAAEIRPGNPGKVRFITTECDEVK